MRISVAMGTFNGATWLPRQLRSLSQQDRLPDELVVLDDCSTDQSPRIIEEFARLAPFPVRLKVQSQNVGSTANFQCAIAAADGEIIATCDQDDVWYPDKLRHIESAFSADPELDLVFSDADLVDESLYPLGYRLWQSVGFTPAIQSEARSKGFSAILARFNVVTGTAMAFVSRRLDLLLPIPQSWVHDGWIALLLSAVGKCAWIDRPLLAYRQHGRQQIGAGRKTLARQIETARQMDGPYFAKLAENFRLALGRVEQIEKMGSASGNPAKLLQQKIAHCLAREAMRDERKNRLGFIARELAWGRYSTCALGWKSLAQDLWFARRGHIQGPRADGITSVELSAQFPSHPRAGPVPQYQSTRGARKSRRMC